MVGQPDKGKVWVPHPRPRQIARLTCPGVLHKKWGTGEGVAPSQLHKGKLGRPQPHVLPSPSPLPRFSGWSWCWSPLLWWLSVPTPTATAPASDTATHLAGAKLERVQGNHTISLIFPITLMRSQVPPAYTAAEIKADMTEPLRLPPFHLPWIHPWMQSGIFRGVICPNPVISSWVSYWLRLLWKSHPHRKRESKFKVFH